MITESNFIQLYNSAVKAFPNTRMRQHAIGTIDVNNVELMPFLGMKTLFIKAKAQNEDREYETILLFKKVNYTDGPNSIRIKDTTGMTFIMEKFSLHNQGILVRCNCADFRWRFNYYDHLDRSLYGVKAPKYIAKTNIKANPLELPGACKHIMATVLALSETGVFRD